MVPPSHKDERPYLCFQLGETRAHVTCFLVECSIHQGAEGTGGLGKGTFAQILKAWNQQKAPPGKA